MTPPPTARLHAGRRRFALGASALALTASLRGVAAQAQAQAQAAPIRIGYQKFNTLNILKGTGNLEKALAPSGVVVQWHEFQAGPQLLEAMNAGSVDFGHAADAPSVFAQAAGVDFV
jgi:ABC-type nitrate/sulfonate/bicarbonate transport system substrate-binding protein